MNAGCTNYRLQGSADTCIHLGSGVAVLCLVSSEFKVYRLMISVQNFCNGYWQPKGHRYKYFWKMPVIMWSHSPQSLFEFDERRRAHICWRILIFRFFHASPVLPLLVLSLATNVNGTDLHYVLARWNLYLYCVCISIAIIRNSLIGFPAIIHPHPLIPGSFISCTTTATESYSLITLETCTDFCFSTLSLQRWDLSMPSLPAAV